MIDIDELDETAKEQLQLLATPLGLPRSGYIRYGAAMYFYQRGKLSKEVLEMYRRCCKLDNEDPLAVAVHDGILAREDFDALSRILY